MALTGAVAELLIDCSVTIVLLVACGTANEAEEEEDDS